MLQQLALHCSNEIKLEDCYVSLTMVGSIRNNSPWSISPWHIHYQWSAFTASYWDQSVVSAPMVFCKVWWSQQGKKSFVNKHFFLNSNNQNLTVEMGCVMVIIAENGIGEKSSNWNPVICVHFRILALEKCISSSPS